MARLRISVALCTYRGERYLQAQLDSIARQGRLPDELVIGDDCSADGTLDIIRRFAGSAPFPVLWDKNGANIGSTRNFQQTIARCSGDIIALSDQDDVWHGDKLQLTEEMFLSSPDVDGVFTNANVVSSDLVPLGYTLWDTFRFSARGKKRCSAGRAFEVLLNHNVATGATMSFRSSLRELLLPIPEEWVHDAWIAVIIALRSGLRFLDRCLIDYRQHEAQQIGGLRRDFAEERALAGKVDDYGVQIRQYRLLAEHLMRVMPNQAGKWQEKLRGKIAHLEARTAMYRNSALSRSGAATRELLTGRYHRYSNGWLSLLKDLFLSTEQLH